MLRPEKIYLNEYIKIKGIEVSYTHAGAIYLADHYEHMLANATSQQLQEKDRQHLALVIRNLQECIQLYEAPAATGNGEASAAGSGDLPASQSPVS